MSDSSPPATQTDLLSAIISLTSLVLFAVYDADGKYMVSRAFELSRLAYRSRLQAVTMSASNVQLLCALQVLKRDSGGTSRINIQANRHSVRSRAEYWPSIRPGLTV